MDLLGKLDRYRKRPELRITEDRPGLYTLWFGKWILLGGTNREQLEHYKALMTI